MYYVKTFDIDHSLIGDVPFESKEVAIKYFNSKCDSKLYNEIPLMNYHSIEIWHDNVLLFDTEG